eukprot:348555_1
MINFYGKIGDINNALKLFESNRKCVDSINIMLYVYGDNHQHINFVVTKGVELKGGNINVNDKCFCYFLCFFFYCFTFCFCYFFFISIFSFCFFVCSFFFFFC